MKHLRHLLLLSLVCFVGLSYSLPIAAQNDEWTIPYTAIGRGQIESVAWYPDNERIFVSTANDVWIYGLDLEVVAHLPNVGFGRLSPNGWYIAGMGDTDAITVWNADTFEVVAVSSEYNPRYETYALEWSPDSLHLASAGRCRIACATIWSAETFEESYSIPATAHKILWNPQGTYVAFHNTQTSRVDSVNPTQRTSTTYQHRHQGYGTVIWQDETNFQYYTPNLGEPAGRITRVDVVTGETIYSDMLNYEWVISAPNVAGFIRRFNRFGMSRIQHDGNEVTAIDLPTSAASWSHEGTRLALGVILYYDNTSGGEIRIFNANTNQFILTFSGFTQHIRHIEWSLNDRYLAVTDIANKITLYDTEEQSLVTQSSRHTQVGFTAAWRPNHAELAVGDTTGGWTLWNVETHAQVTSSGRRQLPYPIRSIAWQPNGRLLYASGLSSYAPGTVPDGLLFDIEQTETNPLPALTEYAGTEENLLRYFYWNPANETAVLYLFDEQQERVVIWSITNDELLYDFPINLEGRVFSWAGRLASISPSGRYLIVICNYTGGCPGIVQNLDDGETQSIDPQHDTRIYVWADDDSLISLSWEVYTFYYFYRFASDISQLNNFHRYAVRGFTEKVDYGFLSSHGRYFAVMDAENNGFAGSIETGNLLFMLLNVAKVVWSPDETQLIVQRTDGTIWLMEADGTILAELDRPRSFNSAGGEFVWSQEGDRLALVNAGYVLVWEIN